MKIVGFQLLTCMLVYVTQVHSIMVKYGTREGPIQPPEPVAAPAPIRKIDYVAPAPVWESRSDDFPDPNANWRPPLFVPYQPRYTQVVVTQNPSTDFKTLEESLTAAQRIAALYKPRKPHLILGSQNVAGLGLAYFMPAYLEVLKEDKKAQEDEQSENSIELENATAESKPQEFFRWHLRSEDKRNRHLFDAAKFAERRTDTYTYVPPPYVESKQFRRNGY